MTHPALAFILIFSFGLVACQVEPPENCEDIECEEVTGSEIDADTSSETDSGTSTDVSSGSDSGTQTSTSVDITEDQPDWPEVKNTFVIDHHYHGDIQASYPDIDWQTLDRLYIPAGEYQTLWLGNLPTRSHDRPLVISNYGGQVIVRNKLVLRGGSNWVFTGKFDEALQIGHEDYQGHAYGQYPNSPGNYGIWIDQNYSGGNGMLVQGGATDFELEFLEISHVGFAGINIKTDGQADAHMRNVKIHDLYIHDAEAECMYIGNTGKAPNSQHRFENLQVYNNRGIRCGAEGLQISHIGDGSRIYNNVFFMAATDWKDPFMPGHDSNAQIMIRTGTVIVENNIFVGAVSNLLTIRALAADSEITSAEDGIVLRNNYFSHGRGRMLNYMHYEDSNLDSYFKLENNYFGKIIFERNELLTAETPETIYFQNKNNTKNPMIFEGNVFEDDTRNGYFGVTGVNGNYQNLAASGNTYGPIPKPKFVNSGFDQNFDYRDFEIWSDCNKAHQSDPDHTYNDQFLKPSKIEISYELGDFVTHHGKMYQLVTPMTEAYNCSYGYWRPCTDAVPEWYPIELTEPNTYTQGMIIDTVEENHYQLVTDTLTYSCEQLNKIPHPADDPNWQHVQINPAPGTTAGAAYWQEVPLPIDDVRLTADSELQGIGLLDNLQYNTTGRSFGRTWQPQLNGASY